MVVVAVVTVGGMVVAGVVVVAVVTVGGMVVAGVVIMGVVAVGGMVVAGVVIVAVCGMVVAGVVIVAGVVVVVVAAGRHKITSRVVLNAGALSPKEAIIASAARRGAELPIRWCDFFPSFRRKPESIAAGRFRLAPE